MDDLSVKLGLDTGDYEQSMSNALDIFNNFQKELNKNKVGFDTSQLEEMNDVFKDIRNTAVRELNAIQKKMDAVSTKQIKLGIDRDILKKQLDEATKTLNATPEWKSNAYADALKDYNKAKAAFDKIEIKLDVEDVELDHLKDKYQKLITDFASNPLEFDFESAELLKFNKEIDNIIDGFDRAGKKVDEFDDKVKKTTKRRAHLNLMGRMMSQMRNSIAAAINPLNNFRKAWNAIINADDSKFGATFKLIGDNLINTLRPAIEAIATWILKLIGYFNVFLKTVSGGKIDLFAKTAKSAKSTATSLKEASKSVAGFDEINDISESSGGGGGSVEASPMGMSDLGLNEEVVSKIQGIAERVKTAFDWIGEHWKEVLIGLAIGLTAVGVAFLLIKKGSPGDIAKGVQGLLDKLGTAAAAIAILGGLALVIKEVTELITAFSESGLTLGEVAGLLGIVLAELAASFALIAVATKLVDITGVAAAAVILGGLALVLNQITKLFKTLADTGMTVGDVGAMLGVILLEVVAAMVAMAAIAIVLSSNPLALIGILALAGAIAIVLATLAATLPTILDACGKFITTIMPPIIDLIGEINKGITAIIYAIGTVLPPILRSIGTIFNTVFSGITKVVESFSKVIDSVFNGIAKVIDTIGNTICKVLNTVKSLVTTVLSSILNFINQLGPAINNFVDNVIIAVTKLINFMISGIEYMVNTLVIDGVNGIIKGINSIGKYVGFTIGLVPKFSIPRFVPKLDVGTGYVPNDMLAVIHQGEAVIPKEFNDKEYFGNNNSKETEETNRLLNTLIERVDAIEFSPYIRTKDIGEAALAYANAKTRITGRSVV